MTPHIAAQANAPTEDQKGESLANYLNVVVIMGVVAKSATLIELRNGDLLTTFDVKVDSPKGPEIVPISWLNAPLSATLIRKAEPVAVFGRVRQYWVRPERSKTDVLATAVVKGRSQARLRRELARYMANLQAVSP